MATRTGESGPTNPPIAIPTRIYVTPAQMDRQLGQVRPGVTTNVTLYAPITTRVGHVCTIVVCNTTAGALLFRVFHDDDATTGDQTTALFYDKSVAANDTFVIPAHSPTGWAVRNPGALIVRSSAVDGLTFTAYGYEVVP